jgi:hypothetical protein
MPLRFPHFSQFFAAAAATPADAPDIRDIHGLVPLTFWEMYHWHIIIACIAVIIITAMVIWLILRSKQVPPPTPIEIARREIAAARLVPAEQHKLFAVVVSDAVRRYLERAYHIPAPERTTEEFLQEMTRHAWMQGKLAELLKRFLEFCDLAKFAGQRFGETEREQLLQSASEFVETAETLRAPAASAGNDASPSVISATPGRNAPATP